MPARYICHNGNFIPDNNPVLSHGNRAFCYGDALFETIRGYGTRPLFFDLHWQRLSEGMKTLGMDAGNISATELEAYLIKLLNKNRIFKGARIRITLYRNEGGLYTPSDSSISWLMESSELQEEKYVLNSKGLHIDIYDAIYKPVNMLSNLKTSNALIFVMAGLHRKKNDLDDCLLLNQFGRITESISSNVFIVKDDQIKTPPLTEGCIAGIMRHNVLEISKDEGFQIQERGVLEKDIYEADEIFLTNSVNGIRWAGAYKDRRFFNFKSKKINNVLNERAFKSLPG